MNYQKIYLNIIEFRKNNPLELSCYGERHHIIPKCLGGTNVKNNIIRLSAREHFICHALLAEMYPPDTEEWYKMNHAFKMMKCNSTDQQRYFNSRLYDLKRSDFRKIMSVCQTGSSNSQKDRIWIHSKIQKISIKIHKDDIEKYLELGFERGRVMNFDLIDKIKSKPKKLKQPKPVAVKTEKVYLSLDGIEFNTYKIKCLNKVFNMSIESSTDILKIKELLIKLYYNDNLSLPEISKLYKTNHVTILNYFKSFNIERRSLSMSLKNYSTNN